MKKYILIILTILTGYAASYAQWVKCGGGLGGVDNDIQAITINGNKIFAATRLEGVCLSTDNGSNWTPKITGGWPLSDMNVVALAIKDIYLFAGLDFGGVERTSDEGINWIDKNSGLNYNSNYVILSFAISGNNIFAGTIQYVNLTTDNGDNWTPKNNGLSGLHVRAFAVSGNNVFGGTEHGVFLTSDNGDTWISKSSGLNNDSVFAFVVSGNNIFAGTKSGIYISNTNGNSWIQKNSGLTGYTVSSFVVSGNFIFAGTNGGGIFISSDNGNNWYQNNSGLTNLQVLSLAIEKDSSYIFAGTTDGDIFRAKISDFANSISILSVNNPLCADSTVTVPVNYSIKGIYNPNNNFIAELSDASGLFTSPVSIGSKKSTTSGTINCKIPNNTPTGNGYRIRVNSTDPVIPGSMNNNDLTLNQLPQPAFFTVNLDVCSGLTYTYKSNSNQGNQWSIKAGKGSFQNASNLQQVQITWNNVTQIETDTLELIQTLNGCPNHCDSVITIYPLPNPKINGNRKDTVPEDTTKKYTCNKSSTDIISWQIEPPTIGNKNIEQGDSVQITWGKESNGKLILTMTNNQGCINYDTINIYIMGLINPNLLAPTMNKPTDNEQKVKLNTNFDWSSVSNAKKYELQVSTKSDFISKKIDTLIANTSFPLSSLDSDITYYWRVRAKDDTRFGIWSSIHSFKTEAAPGALSLTLNIKVDTICKGQSAQLEITEISGGTPPYTKLWSAVPNYSFTPGQDTSNILTVTPIVSTTFTITVTDNSQPKKQKSENIIVTVNFLPDTILTEKTNVNVKDTVTYFTTKDADTYEWTITGGTPSTGNSDNILVKWGSPGTGSIKLIKTNSCGKDSIERQVIINTAPFQGNIQMVTKLDTSKGSSSGVTINVQLSSVGSDSILSLAGSTYIKGNLTIQNASILYPSDTNSWNLMKNSDTSFSRKKDINLTVTNGIVTPVTESFIATLGNDTATIISFQPLNSDGNIGFYTVPDLLFKLGSVCSTFGKLRLINSYPVNTTFEINPNPINNDLEIIYAMDKDIDYEITISDMNGRESILINKGRSTGNNETLNYNTSKLSTGTYIINLKSVYGSISKTVVINK